MFFSGEISVVIFDAFLMPFCYQKSMKNCGFWTLSGDILWFWEEVGSRTLLGIDFGVHLGCPGEVLGSTWGAQGMLWEPFGWLWGSFWALRWSF